MYREGLGMGKRDVVIVYKRKSGNRIERWFGIQMGAWYWLDRLGGISSRQRCERAEALAKGRPAAEPRVLGVLFLLVCRKLR
jgi:hypothetical protein